MKAWFRVGALAAIDQAWLSFISFAIAIAFIRGADKSEYGIYLLLLTPLFLVQGVQNALFLSPFTTLFPSRKLGEQERIMQTMVWGQAAFSAILFGVTFFGLLIYQWMVRQTINPVLGAAFAFAVVGTIAREAARSAQYVQGMAGIALFGDLIYGGILLSGVTWLYSQSAVHAVWVLFFTGVAGIAPLAVRLVNHGKPLPKPGLDPVAWLEFWQCGRWALKGATLTWVNLNAYPYVVAVALGVSAVADINAARLFLMPAVLCITAWSNLVRPRFSRWFSAKEKHRMRKTSKFSIGAGILGLTVFSIAIVLTYPYLEQFLGPSYRNLLPLVSAWSVYFLFSFTRTVFMATLMVNEAGYQKLTSISWLSLALVIPGMLIAVQYNTLMVVGVLILIELVQMLLTFRHAYAFWKAS